ncbi:MAG: hypothetical protein CYG60_03455 [Actinobacteria bacterium]|nr:MAG: hypothetical protein CYG60_03455 [Actinomycetota bacterium]
MKTEAQTLLTVAEVAEELRVSRNRVYELIARGYLRGVRVGERQIRVRRQDLDAFFEDNFVVDTE